MRPPETPESPIGQPNRPTVARRHKLLRSSSLSSEASGSPESASSAPEGSEEVRQSTAAHKEAANPATAHPSHSVRTSGLESGDDPEQLLRQEQAALMLGLTPRCLENWRHRGGGPSYVRVSARCIRYRRSDLHEWIEARLRTSTSDYGTDTA